MNRPLRLTVCSLRISRIVRLAFCGMFAMFWQSVSNILAIPFAMFWAIRQQLREPIYRARVYENTHEMEEENVRALK